MPLSWIVFVASEERNSCRFVDRLHSQHFEIARSQLPLQLCLSSQRILLVETIQIQMRVPIAPARPQEAVSRLQHAEVIVHIDPRIRTGLGQNNVRLARLRIHEVQVHLALNPVEHFDPDHSVADPAKARNEDILVVGQRNPANLVTVRVHHAQLHDRIRICHFGILFLVQRRMRRDPIGNRIRRHLALVHVEKDDLLAVGRPVVIAAHRQLFGVHPIDVAIEQVVFLVLGELLLVLSADRPHVKVVFADVRHVIAIRRELGIAAGIRRRSKLHRRAAAQIVEPELPLRIEDQML